MTTQLTKYDAACRAVAEAKSVDEAKDIHDVAAAMEVYARQVKNKQIEADAKAIRMRAKRRIDELRRAQKAAVGLAKGGGGKHGRKRVIEKPTLASQGIDKNLAQQARTLGAMSDERFEDAVADARASVTAPKPKRARSPKKAKAPPAPAPAPATATTSPSTGTPSTERVLPARDEGERREHLRAQAFKLGDQYRDLAEELAPEYAERLRGLVNQMDALLEQVFAQFERRGNEDAPKPLSVETLSAEQLAELINGLGPERFEAVMWALRRHEVGEASAVQDTADDGLDIPTSLRREPVR